MRVLEGSEIRLMGLAMDTELVSILFNGNDCPLATHSISVDTHAQASLRVLPALPTTAASVFAEPRRL